AFGLYGDSQYSDFLPARAYPFRMAGGCYSSGAVGGVGFFHRPCPRCPPLRAVDAVYPAILPFLYPLLALSITFNWGGVVAGLNCGAVYPICRRGGAWITSTPQSTFCLSLAAQN